MIFTLKLIICYISSGATNIAEVSSGFHQADWSNTLVIVYCYLISFLFCFICLLFYLFLARSLIVCICRRQVNLNLRYIYQMISFKFISILKKNLTNLNSPLRYYMLRIGASSCSSISTSISFSIPNAFSFSSSVSVCNTPTSPSFCSVHPPLVWRLTAAMLEW